MQGNQTSASFTQGAETNSLFGLNPGYTKYLIDGRPMANYPALYNGCDMFNNISGIPIDLVERIEILPGGQSSLYGSDAIAGVVNIILKKKIDGTVLSVRVGRYDEGGGDSARISLATSFGSADGRFNMLFGAQFETSDPIWGYERDLTKQFNQQRLPIASAGCQPRLCSSSATTPATSSSIRTTAPTSPRLRRHRRRADTVRPRQPYCGSMYTPGLRHAEERQGKRPDLLARHLRRQRQHPAVRRCPVQQ